MNMVFVIVFFCLLLFFFFFFFLNICFPTRAMPHIMDPTTDGLIMRVFLWSHHDHRHLIMRMSMRTFIWRDNVDYVITHQHRQTNLLHFFTFFPLGQGPEWSFRKSVVTSDQLEEQWTPNYDNLCNIRLIIKEVGHWCTYIWICQTLKNTYSLLFYYLLLLWNG